MSDANSQPNDTPTFREPWEAQAFAIVVALHQRGLFSWAEWTRALGSALARAPQTDTGETYYHHWLAALEALVAAKGLSSLEELTRCQRAWKHAAQRTPHGMPIDLCAEDIGG